MNILIVKTAALGDVLRTTSFLRPLKEKYHAEIDWLTGQRAVDLLVNNPNIRKLYLLEKNEDCSRLEMQGTAFYDLVISLEEDLHPARIATQLGKKKLVGVYVDHDILKYTPETRSWFDMSLISVLGKEHADVLKRKNTQSYQNIWMDILQLEKKHYKPVFMLTPPEKQFAVDFAKEHKLPVGKNHIILGFNTGAGKTWPMKSLSVEKTAALIDLASEKLGAKVLLFGGKDETDRNHAIIARCKYKPLNAGSANTLRQFAALINLTQVMVVADTLALHLSLALGKKVVAFFGPTSAAEIELYGKGQKICADSLCYCCYKRDYVKHGCSDGYDEKMLFKALSEEILPPQ